MLSRIGIALVLTLSVLLTACARATTVSTPIPSSPQPTLPPAKPVSTSEPVGVGVPAIEYVNQANKLLVISSITGKALDAFTPIPLGGSYSYIFVPRTDIHWLLFPTASFI